MEPTSVRYDLYYQDRVVNLEASVLNTAPQDWQLEQHSIDRETLSVLRLVKPTDQRLSFQLVIDEPPTAGGVRSRHTLQVFGPPMDEGDPVIQVARIRNTWVDSLVDKVQGMLKDDTGLPPG
jgi:hypothetical protein